MREFIMTAIARTILPKPETAPARPSVISAKLGGGVVVRMPDNQKCSCGRLLRPCDAELTGTGLRQICPGCHALILEIEL
jgi:hypothetical protein